MLLQNEYANTTAYQNIPTIEGLQNAHIKFKVLTNNATRSIANIPL